MFYLWNWINFTFLPPLSSFNNRSTILNSITEVLGSITNLIDEILVKILLIRDQKYNSFMNLIWQIQRVSMAHFSSYMIWIYLWLLAFSCFCLFLTLVLMVSFKGLVFALVSFICVFFLFCFNSYIANVL